MRICNIRAGERNNVIYFLSKPNDGETAAQTESTECSVGLFMVDLEGVKR